MVDLNKKIKPGDGSMVDSEVKFQTSEYTGIERKVKPEDFYTFLNLKKNDEFDNDSVLFHLSITHYALMESIRTQLMKVSKSGITRGLVSLGIIAQAKQHNIMNPTIKALIKKYQNQRCKAMDQRFEKSYNRIKFDHELTKSRLPDIVKKYADKDYGDRLWKSLYSTWEMPKLVLNVNNLNISQRLLDLAGKIVSDKLTDKMYVIKDTKSLNLDLRPSLVRVTISDRFSIVSHEFHRLFASDKHKGQLFRGYLITGLFILSKWIVTGKISQQEHHFNKLIDAIDRLASEY